MMKTPLVSTLISLSLLMFLFFVSLSVGDSLVGSHDVFNWLSFHGDLLSSDQLTILENFRLPRTMTAITVGMSLALAGYWLQVLLENPLAEPYTLGVSGGATLGAILAILIGLEPLSTYIPLGSLLGAGGATLAVLIYIRITGFQSRALVLFGILISLFCGSLIVLLMSLFEPERLHLATHWMMGFCGTPRDQWWPAGFLTFALTYLYAFLSANNTDLMLLGEDIAKMNSPQIGTHKIAIVIAVSLLTASSVSLMGLVGFLGLIAPHISSLVTQSRRVLPNLTLTVFTGASLLLGADIVGRLIGGVREIPAGSLVAVCGAPFLAFLLIKNLRQPQ